MEFLNASRDIALSTVCRKGSKPQKLCTLCRQLWEELAAVGSPDFQAAARAQAAEAEPGIRYCTYKLGGDPPDTQQPTSFVASSDVTAVAP